MKNFAYFSKVSVFSLKAGAFAEGSGGQIYNAFSRLTNGGRTGTIRTAVGRHFYSRLKLVVPNLNDDNAAGQNHLIESVLVGIALTAEIDALQAEAVRKSVD